MRNLNRQHHHGRTVQNKRKQEHNTVLIGQTQSQNVTNFRSNCTGLNENKSIRFVILRPPRAVK